MPLSTISLGRPLTSYARVQSWITQLIRNREFQIKRQTVTGKKYLDVGCGSNTHDDFINLDFVWQPGVDVCWDISKGLPFSDGTIQAIYSEHCLEHFSLPQARFLLREFCRVLKPNGAIRIVVPDAEIYLRTYVKHLNGEKESFPYGEMEAFEGLWTPMLSVNRVFYHDRESPSGHCTMYDFALLRAMLLQQGFRWVEKCEFGSGRDSALLIDSPERRAESLYVEAGVS